MRIARAARASLVAAAMLATAVGIATPASANSGCTDTSKPFYVCVDSSTWYRYADGNTHVSVSLHSSHYTDYRIFLTTSSGVGATYLAYPGDQRTTTFSGRQTITACGQEATYGKYCVTVSPTTSNAGF